MLSLAHSFILVSLFFSFLFFLFFLFFLIMASWFIHWLLFVWYHYLFFFIVIFFFLEFFLVTFFHLICICSSDCVYVLCLCLHMFVCLYERLFVWEINKIYFLKGIEINQRENQIQSKPKQKQQTEKRF